MPPPPKKKIAPQIGQLGGKKTARVKKNSGPTQKTPMQRVMIIGPTGKKRLEWRSWGS